MIDNDYEEVQLQAEPSAVAQCNEDSSDDESYIANLHSKQTKTIILRFRKSDADELIRRNLFKDSMDHQEAEKVDDITELNIMD